MSLRLDVIESMIAGPRGEIDRRLYVAAALADCTRASRRTCDGERLRHVALQTLLPAAAGRPTLDASTRVQDRHMMRSRAAMLTIAIVCLAGLPGAEPSLA
ncbi:MAG TPA: hypothetical protein PL152_11040, partial [Steroidobacteraceae bacterium]|nr:hypothetical protein [Steroidobacteraceae bacterium]